MTVCRQCPRAVFEVGNVAECLRCALLVDCYPGTVIPIDRQVKRGLVAAGVVLAIIAILFLVPWSS